MFETTRGRFFQTDRAVWFTEDSSNANNIGKVTTSGVFTEYPIPYGCCAVFITAGPDGNLWFTGGLGITKVTTSGVFTGYPVPGSRSALGITAGPDGNLWFTEFFA